MNRIIAAGMLALGFYNLVSFGLQYRVLQTLNAGAYTASPKPEDRERMLLLRQRSLLSPWNDLGMIRAAYLTPDALQEKINLNTLLLRTWPSADNAFRQSILLAIDGREDEAKRLWSIAVHTYPSAKPEVLKVLEGMRIGLPGLNGFIDWARK